MEEIKIEEKELKDGMIELSIEMPNYIFDFFERIAKEENLKIEEVIIQAIRDYIYGEKAFQKEDK